MSIGYANGDVRIGDFAPHGCGIDLSISSSVDGKEVIFEARITYETDDLDYALGLTDYMEVNNMVPLYVEVWGDKRQRRGDVLEYRLERRRNYKGHANIYRVEALIRGPEQQG